MKINILDLGKNGSTAGGGASGTGGLLKYIEKVGQDQITLQLKKQSKIPTKHARKLLRLMQEMRDRTKS